MEWKVRVKDNEYKYFISLNCKQFLTLTPGTMYGIQYQCDTDKCNGLNRIMLEENAVPPYTVDPIIVPTNEPTTEVVSEPQTDPVTEPSTEPTTDSAAEKLFFE